VPGWVGPDELDRRTHGRHAGRTGRGADGVRFTWQIYGLPKDDPRRTYVEFTLEPVGAGTRLTVVESGFAQLPADAHRTAYEGNTKGWARELGSYLDAA